MQPITGYQSTVEYVKWYMEVYVLMNPIVIARNEIFIHNISFFEFNLFCIE